MLNHKQNLEIELPFHKLCRGLYLVSLEHGVNSSLFIDYIRKWSCNRENICENITQLLAGGCCCILSLAGGAVVFYLSAMNFTFICSINKKIKIKNKIKNKNITQLLNRGAVSCSCWPPRNMLIWSNQNVQQQEHRTAATTLHLFPHEWLYIHLQRPTFEQRTLSFHSSSLATWQLFSMVPRITQQL
jgi:hypothetical protein